MKPIPTPPALSYFVPGEVTSPKFAQAFAKGCQGQVTNVLTSLQGGPFAAFCTPPLWPLLRQAIKEGREYYYGDHAYWRRGKYYRIAKNRYQAQITEADLREARPDRLHECHAQVVPDWRKNVGTSVVICPNSLHYMSEFAHVNAHTWALRVTEEVQKHTDRPIVIRWKSSASRRPLELDLHDAWAVVVYSSNAAVEAICAGVPVFVMAPWASTAPMGKSSLAEIEQPLYPDARLPFLWALAEQQWTLSEIATGMAWKRIHHHAENLRRVQPRGIDTRHYCPALRPPVQ